MTTKTQEQFCKQMPPSVTPLIIPTITQWVRRMHAFKRIQSRKRLWYSFKGFAFCTKFSYNFQYFQQNEIKDGVWYFIGIAVVNFLKLLFLNFALAVDCCINCLHLSNTKHCTLSALDTACVCFKISVSAVFCLDILQLYSIGLSFAWHSVYVFRATVNVLNK